MSEKFDVAVVGAGLAGCTAALAAAQAGLQVLVVERGSRAGTKTVSGGLLYAHALTRLFPKFWEENPSPVERAIERNVVTLLTPRQAISLDYFDADFAEPPFNAFSVLRGRLDPWLAAKAEAAGATVVYGVRVDELLRESGRVVGLRADADDIRADVTIVADGANAQLARLPGQAQDPSPRVVGVGVKQVIGLPTGEVERRFLLRGRAGAQYTTLGFPDETAGGGFVYTNVDSVSIGMILNMRSLIDHETAMYDVLEKFKQHPLLARMLEGGTLLEYSGCFVSEGGYRALPPVYGEGCLVAGSAAGFFLNSGFTLRGMDFAIESGRLAGEVAAASVRAKDPSATFLSRYRGALDRSFVMKDLRAFDGAPAVFENPRLYARYPKAAASLLHRAFFVDGVTRPHLNRLLTQAFRGLGPPAETIGDLWKAMRTL